MHPTPIAPPAGAVPPAAAPATQPRCLVLVAAPDRVHAPEALPSDPARAFDIAVWGCGDLPDGASRWPALGRLLRGHPALWQPYDLVWLPDHHVQADGRVVATMAALMHAHELWLAQPALDGAGAGCEQPVERHNPAFVLRTTNWVGESMPCFRREFLAAVLDSFELGGGAPGLGHLWAALAPRGRVAVLDAVPVARRAGAPAEREASEPLRRRLAACGVSDLRTFSSGGVDTSGRVLGLHDEATRDAFVGRLLLGCAQAGIDDPAALGALLATHLAALHAPPAAPRPMLRRSPIVPR